MRRVLYVCDAASVHTRRWAEYFYDQGIEVHVASFRPAKIDGVEIHVLSTGRLGRPGYLFAIPQLRALWRKLRPDVVHAQYVTSYGYIAAMAGLHPLVVTAWGTDVLISPRQSQLSKFLAHFALRDADVVTTVAEHMNAAVVELGVPADRVIALPFGVDCQRFHLPEVPPSPPPPLRLICTRNFAPVYAVDSLIEAVAQVRGRGLSIEVDLVGAGPLETSLRELVQRFGLDNIVRFRGHVDHATLARWLGDHHVFVTPARSDGNNVSLNEAMACGCFPIATDIPANSQWLRDGDNGLLYPAGDAQALARCIERAAADPAWRARAAVQNRRIVEERADWRSGAEKMKSLYAQAMARHAQKG